MMIRKGIILAGGNGTRLFPSSLSISKHLLPVYDKPMIYYPLSTLMLADIKEILIISNFRDLDAYKYLFETKLDIGIKFSFVIQEETLGIAHALILAEDFLQGSHCSLILGDNFFYGHDLSNKLLKISSSKLNTIFGYPVEEPKNFGVVEFDNNLKIKSISEKPESPNSRYAIPGLYFFDETAIDRAKLVKKGPRNEYEITDVLNSYLRDDKLDLQLMGRGEAWLDAGSHENLLDASLFVRSVERRQGLKIGCPEEIAWRKGWITNDDLIKIVDKYEKNSYSDYLKSLPRDTIIGVKNEK